MPRRHRAILPCAFALITLAACSSSDDAVVETEADAAVETDVSTEATEPPATEPTVTDPPATDPPATDPPATDPPATDPPATEPPAAEPADTSPPATEAATTTSTPPGSDDDDAAFADRPYDVFVPTSYDTSTPMPLVMLLHGYTASGDIQEAYFNFEPLAESRGFLYVHPDGTVDPRGEQYWNATDACCSFGRDTPDDAAYLMSIIEQVSTDYAVDPKAIFLAGHSNGGFMSYRMACQHADTIAGIASLAGASFADPADCAPAEPVSVLQIHGTDDETIAYDGASIIGVDYPGALQSVEAWVENNNCDDAPATTADVLDLDGGIDGAESDIEAFSGCAQGAAVELWTIDGGRHVPLVTTDFSAGVVDFLLAHPKP